MNYAVTDFGAIPVHEAVANALLPKKFDRRTRKGKEEYAIYDLASRSVHEITKLAFMLGLESPADLFPRG